MLVHCKATPNFKLSGIHLHTCMGRCNVRATNYLVQEHIAVTSAGLEPGPLNSSALTIRPSRRPLIRYLYHVYTYPMNKVHIGKVHHSTGNTPTHSYQLQARQLSFTFLQRRNSTFLLVYFTVALRSLGGDLNRTLILLFYCFKFNFTQTKRIGLDWNLYDQHKRKHKKDLIEVPVRSDLVSHSP